MNYWLVKSDPESYGWESFLKDKKTEWTGVRNYAARIHLKAMNKGDLVLFYHSQQSPAIIGIAMVSKESYQDPTTNDPAWVAVELSVVKRLNKPVTLTDIKSEKRLSELPLIKISRLSVMPVSANEFTFLLSMGDTKL
ncbi:MAG: EVE domain-containing protein [Chitinophagales bacterium]|nr:EVE domain-containing protein [Chitinophagales bacterium]